MTVFSKLQPSLPQDSKFGSFNCVNGTCHELIHTWNNSCIESIIDLFKSGLKSSLKIYLMFYSLKFLFQWKKNKRLGIKESLKRLITSVLRSTLFLGMHAPCMMFFICVLNKIIGRLHLISLSITGCVTGFFVVMLEKEGRRPLLSLYLLNMATEILYNMAVSRGIVTPVNGGGIFLFCVVSSAYMSLFRAGGLPEFFQNSLKNIVGQDEDDQERERLKKQSHKSRIMNSFVYYAKSYVIRNFVYGYLIQLGLNSKSLLNRILGKSTLPISKLFTDMHLAKFISIYTFLFHMTNCLLKNYFEVDRPGLFGAVAGFVAGSSSVFFRSTSVTLYLFFKMIDILFTKAIERKVFPRLPHAHVICYALSFGVVCHAALFEPHNIRPSYWRQLQDLTGNRFSLCFRKMFEGIVLDSSRLYPNFVPNLDPRYVKSMEVRKVLSMHGM